MSTLKVEGLTAGYGSVPVLRDVSLECSGNQLVAILGANGAGKSTCLKAIVGLIGVKSGKVTLEGESLVGMGAEATAKCGVVMVPEGRALFTGMHVKDNLLVGAHLYRRDKIRVKEDLARVLDLFPKLQTRLRQDVGTLSGGEQQMVALGRALMARPKFLLLDEPSLGLAPIVFQLLMSEVAALRATGTAILLVEQNVQVTLQYADYVYVLERGRVVSEGSASEIGDSSAIKVGYLARGTV